MNRISIPLVAALLVLLGIVLTLVTMALADDEAAGMRIEIAAPGHAVNPATAHASITAIGRR